tara:strand:- start:1242 stop:1439 length:198 start_codon:yes stop_codon:yes gene_type:complete
MDAPSPHVMGVLVAKGPHRAPMMADVCPPAMTSLNVQMVVMKPIVVLSNAPISSSPVLMVHAFHC